MSKIVIFDMDGTLIDSDIAICQTVNYVRKESNLEPLANDEILEIVNNPSINPIKTLYNIDKPSAGMRYIFNNLFNENYMKYARAYDEAKKLLELCKEEKFKIALATNAPHKQIESILKVCKIEEYFDFTIGSSDKVPQKPDPYMLNLIKDKFDCKSSIFIGDSKKDFLAAKNANMPYVQVIWGTSRLIDGVLNSKDSKEIIKFIKEEI